ncbi:MAG: hypothetical protein FJ009_14990 [Chloroflexi bacterium]|nr:hypothetical protein [Chloroflexota bacterium]
MIDIQVDQSGRIEVLTVDTALGFSNGRQVAVLIPAAVKRNCSKQLLARGIRPKMVSIRMFAAGLYLLLEKHLNQIASVTIDREFPGREAEIKGLVLQHVYRRAPRFVSEKITFGEIGKQARAHNVAWRTYRRERPPEKRITLGELLRFC